MRRHFSEVADDCCPNIEILPRRRDIEKHFDYVYLQTWTSGSRRRYWIIERNGNLLRPVDGEEIQNHLRVVHEREQKQGQDEESRALQPTSVPPQLSYAEQRPWIERTGWDQTYSDKGRRKVLAALITMDSCPSGQAYLLARQGISGLTEGLVSSTEDEMKIAVLVKLVDPMLDRCEETARKTGRSILCWLRSTRALSTYPKPFTLVRHPSSMKKYRLLFKKFLCMVFRLYRMSSSARRRVAGLRWSGKQSGFLDAIWNHESWKEDILNALDLKTNRGDTNDGVGEQGANDSAEEDDGDESEEDETEGEDEASDDGNQGNDDSGGNVPKEAPIDNSHETASEDSDDETFADETEQDSAEGSVQELLELLFGLSLELITEPVIDGQPQTTTLIYFSGILGFSPSLETFLPARSYTPYLSGLIYVLRLLFLEYALPLQGYASLGIERRPRIHQLERLEPIRRQYMVMESQSPFEERISLRNYGHAISRSDTPPFLLHWSDDGHTVSLGDEISVSMGQFRLLPEYFIREANRLCSEMMFDWDPAIDLAQVKDDMTNNAKGFSFVLHPDNKLPKAYLDLCDRACKARHGGLLKGSDWDWSAVFRYLKKDEELRGYILGTMDCTSGQKPRCLELLSLYCANGEFGPRGIFVYNRMMVYLVRHHKAKRSTNREFIVARFLPAQVGHILYKYLVYIRPFVDMLHREGQTKYRLNSPGSPLLFRQEAGTSSKSWQTRRLTAILKAATLKVWGIPINSRQFRQLCIGITEKHVREVYEPLNRFDDKSQRASRNVVFAWQSGHRPLQHAAPTDKTMDWSSNPPRYNKSMSYSPPAQQTTIDLSSGQSSPQSLNYLQQYQQTGLDLPLDDSRCNGEDAAAFLHGIHRQTEGAFESESLRYRQQATRYQPANHKRSVKRARQQEGDSHDAASHTKRIRFLQLVPDLELNREHRLRQLRRMEPVGHAGQDPTSDGTSNWPLFGYPHELMTINVTDDRQAILDRLRGRSDISKDNNLARSQSRVRQLGDQLERWRIVGCQLCYASDEPDLDHDLENCTRADSARARQLLAWLESLRLDRFGPIYGFCSLCHEADELCREWVTMCRIRSASTEESKTHWKEVFSSATGPDGLCNNKQAVRRTIAALCAFDNQILGKTLTKFVSDKDGIDLTAEGRAAEWFERRIPLGETWIPQLLIVLDILAAAFDFLQARKRLNQRLHDEASQGSASVQNAIPSLEMSWDDEGEVAEWRRVVDWWVDKCSFCAGRGIGGKQVGHTLRQCAVGGKPLLRKGLAEAIYEEGMWALGGCRGCALPREFCQAWSRDITGAWERNQGILCQYGRQIYDTAIGFFYCKNRKYREDLMESMAAAGLNEFDGEEVAIWLGKKITVAGVESSEIMRQLRCWSKMLWETMKD
ncbi:hypothetical protein BFJ69_g16984 [Fusarium oxysporum]|uniref:Uncharacterized protein n=1 Tax=Fusarium oxysporum TaxID=5507 RepID=A0A420M9J1_FUSOX|nr:hypothetical protein BFJ69_g16984 [Fusarium oxysporum]